MEYLIVKPAKWGNIDILSAGVPFFTNKPISSSGMVQLPIIGGFGVYWFRGRVDNSSGQFMK